jgi:hypothetical protein
VIHDRKFSKFMTSSQLINDDNLTYEIGMFACEYCAKMASKSMTHIAGASGRDVSIDIPFDNNR